MNSFGNFLWKIFSVTMVFFCHIGTGYTEGNTRPCDISEGEDPNYLIKSDIGKVSYLKKSSEVTQKSSKTLCKANTYLAKCGDYTIGTNWLFGMSVYVKRRQCSLNGQYESLTSLARATPNYRSYASSNDSVNMENLRKFFNGTETMVYTIQNSDENDHEAVQPAGYVLYRDIILSNICTDSNGKPTENIVCTPCPNNASVAASKVDTVYGTGKIVFDSWNIHTIADCYMREFSDETGEYVYTANNVNSDTGINCYYTTNVSGSYLPRTDKTDTNTEPESEPENLEQQNNENS